MFIRNIKLVPRTVLTFGITCVLLVLLGVQSLWRMENVQWSITDLQDNCLPSVRQAGLIEAATYRLRVANLLFAMGDLHAADAAAEQVSRRKDALLQETAAYVPLIYGPEEQRLYDIVNANVKTFTGQVEQLLALGRTASQEERVRFINSTSAPAAEVLLKSTGDLQRLMMERAEQSGAKAREEAHDSTVATIAVVSIALLVTCILTLVFTRSIIVPLRELLGVTQKVAGGNLVGDIGISGKDELTELQSATAQMLTRFMSTDLAT